jgi:ubiquinone/menaquinone biosynthesis C-methylase UbiE
MEMAADFPNPSYFGIDILPVYPTSTVPINITFQQHDLLKGLPYDDNTFDFVHIQLLVFDLTELQWETIVFHELARILKPGGWLEICDMEYGILNCGPITKRFDLSGKIKKLLK